MTMRWLVQLPRVISKVIRDKLASSSKVNLDWNESFAASPVIHYPVFISTKTRKQSQVSLFSKRIPISILFITLSIYFNLCLPWQRRQKCLLAPTSVTTGKQRWRPQTPIWGGSISWSTNNSTSAQNTAIAFYPRVYRGVIYISAGKAVSEGIYTSWWTLSRLDILMYK